MPEDEPKQIHYVQLEPGQALLVSVVKRDHKRRNPDLLEEVRVIARIIADSMVSAMSGDLSFRYDLDVDHGEVLNRLGNRLHQADVPADVVFSEAKSVYRESRMGHNDALVNDLAGYFVDRLSYSPKEAA